MFEFDILIDLTLLCDVLSTLVFQRRCSFMMRPQKLKPETLSHGINYFVEAVLLI